MQLIYQYFRSVHHAKKKSGFPWGREESFKVFSFWMIKCNSSTISIYWQTFQVLLNNNIVTYKCVRDMLILNYLEWECDPYNATYKSFNLK